MEIVSTGINGLFEVYPKIYNDNRGYFLEAFTPKFQEKIGHDSFVQDNLSFSKKGVVRGLHLQLPPFAQSKIVSVVKGKVQDVAVDLRKGSVTFGKWYSCILDDEKHNMLVIPEGFAHGFAALEDSYFYYKCSKDYQPKYEAGVIWNDSSLNIKWDVEQPLVSDKDLALPSVEVFLKNIVDSRND